jgi:hypothetical protein
VVTEDDDVKKYTAPAASRTTSAVARPITSFFLPPPLASVSRLADEYVGKFDGAACWPPSAGWEPLLGKEDCGYAPVWPIRLFAAELANGFVELRPPHRQ